MPFEQDGSVYCRKFGSRREVLDGVAYCTSGKLTADRLEERGGKIISRKRSELGKVRYAEKNPFRPDDEKIAEPKNTKKVKPKKSRKRKATTKPLRDEPTPSAAVVSSEPAAPQPQLRILRRRRRRRQAIRVPRMGQE